MSKDLQKKELVKIYKKLNNLYKSLFKKENNLSGCNYSSFYKDGLFIDYDRITNWSTASMYFDIKTKRNLEKFISKSKKLVNGIKSKFVIEFIGYTEFLHQFKRGSKNTCCNENGDKIENDIFEENIPVHISILVRENVRYPLGTIFKCDELFFDETKDYNDESYKPLKKHLKYQDQRQKFKDKHGFDPSEVWSLDTIIAMFILPRLIRLKEIKHGLFWDKSQKKPLSLDQTNRIYDKMIKAFYWIVIRNGVDCLTLSGIKEKEIQEGLDLFSKYFNELFD